MSTVLMGLVWPLNLTSVQKIVLVSICDQANDGGYCWPGVETLEIRTNLAERTVRTALTDLERMGFIARHYRANTSTVYQVLVHSGHPLLTEYASKPRRKKNRAPEFDMPFAVTTPKQPPQAAPPATPAPPAPPASPAPPAGDAPPAPPAPPAGHAPPAGDAPPPAPPAPAPAPHAPGGAGDAPLEVQEVPPNRNTTHIESPVTPIEPFSDGAKAPPAAAPKKRERKKADNQDAENQELQAACMATWAAYKGAYVAQYGVAPVRNAKVNKHVKDFVKRIGYEESPSVAAWYVENVREAFVVRSSHCLSVLMNRAESYRTQWARGHAVTNAAAQEVDKLDAQLSVVQQAKEILRNKNGGRNAQ